jgi:hypothetical protein
MKIFVEFVDPSAANGNVPSTFWTLEFRARTTGTQVKKTFLAWKSKRNSRHIELVM